MSIVLWLFPPRLEHHPNLTQSHSCTPPAGPGGAHRFRSGVSDSTVMRLFASCPFLKDSGSGDKVQCRCEANSIQPVSLESQQQVSTTGSQVAQILALAHHPTVHWTPRAPTASGDPSGRLTQVSAWGRASAPPMGRGRALLMGSFPYTYF